MPNAENVKSAPKISVLIATYNNAGNIDICLQSILSQPLEEIEVIIVDAGSTDGTKDFVEEKTILDERVTFLTDSYGSIGHAKNMAFNHAAAPYVIFVEPDDQIHPLMLKKLLLKAESAPDIEAIYCETSYFGDDYLAQMEENRRDKERELNGTDEPEFERDSRLFRVMAFDFAAMYRRDYLERKGLKHYELPGHGAQNDAFRFLALAYAHFSVIGVELYHRRVKAPFNLISEKADVLSLCDEYRFLQKELQKTPEKWQKLKSVFWQAYFQANLTTYGKLAEDLRPRLSDRMYDDLRSAVKAGEFNLKYSDVLTRDKLSLILSSPREFDSQQGKALDEFKRAYERALRRQDEDDAVNKHLFSSTPVRPPIDSNRFSNRLGRLPLKPTQEYDRYRLEKKAKLHGTGTAHPGNVKKPHEEEHSWEAAEYERQAHEYAVEEEERRKKYVLNRKWLMDEMGRDLAPLRLLLGLSVDEMGGLLGVSSATYKGLEAGKREVSWDQFLALLFVFSYNDRTAGVVETLGLFPDPLKRKIKTGGTI